MAGHKAFDQGERLTRCFGNSVSPISHTEFS